MESTDQIIVRKANESLLHIECDRGIASELSEYFSFEAPGARFMPSVKNKVWDGKLRFFNLRNNTLPVGHYLHLHKFCKDRGYKITKVETEFGLPLESRNIDIDHLNAWIDSLQLTAYGEDITVHDYQIDAIYQALRYQRKLFLSPTSSGKSLIIYLVVRYILEFLRHDPSLAVLIVCPTTNLIHQMVEDFKDYSTKNGWNVDKHTAKIMAGLPKDPSADIVVSTWQSIYKQSPAVFARYYALIGDEVHQHKAACIGQIATKCTNAKYKIGMTGTLDGEETNQMNLEGLFGNIVSVTTTKELQDRGIVARLNIKCLNLQYPENIRKAMARKEYQEEISFLCASPIRNGFIVNLVSRQTKNTLVLFNFVDKHGKILFNMLKEAMPERDIFFVSGKIESEERNTIRKIMEKKDNAVVVASYGTFSTGVNIRNLHNVVMASPTKSRIRNLQSIGRGLRITTGKEECNLFDISDDLSYKAWQNYTLKGFIHRTDIYVGEGFDYKLITIPIKVHPNV